MPRFVALLQGINVGKNRRIAMSDLREIVEALGHADVKTHLNSGNVVFTAAHEDDAALARELEAAIAARTGFDVPVVVRTGEELRGIVENNPFPDAAADHTTLHVTFLGEEPAAEKVAALEARDTGEDDWRIVGKDVYLFYPNKTTGATFTLDGIGVVATSRNWRTVTRLAELASEG
jgi:uncharacterized protein (DUF1697 family)